MAIKFIPIQSVTVRSTVTTQPYIVSRVMAFDTAAEAQAYRDEHGGEVHERMFGFITGDQFVFYN